MYTWVLIHHLTISPVQHVGRIVSELQNVLTWKKFTIHIIRNMAMMNRTRFNQFLDNIKEITPKTLSARLKEMEKAN